MRLGRPMSFVAAVLGVALLAGTVYSDPEAEVSEWDVQGLHNELGAYQGKATITVTGQKKVKIEVTSRLSSGEKLDWSGHGKLDMGNVELTMDLPSRGVAEALAGTGGPGLKGQANYVIADDRIAHGYWQVMSQGPRAKKGKPRGGGTETLTLRKGKPLLGQSLRLPPPKLPADALQVPLVSQPDEYSCGAACLQSILYYYKVSDDGVRKLYHPLGTNAEYGTEEEPIVDFAKTRGLKAEYRRSGVTLADLRASIARKDPVMLILMAWRANPTIDWKTDEEDGHYVVAIGVDEHYTYFMDPSAHFAYGYIPNKELMDRWHHFDTDSHGRLQRLEQGAIFFRGKPAPDNGQLVRIQ